MKKIIIFLFLFPFWGLGGLYAQKELWGTYPGNEFAQGYSASNRGNIIKFDINGENPVIMHQFDSIHGRLPMGKLFLASNGKLYGTASKGGNLYTYPNSTVTYEGGVLFEYDLTLDKFRIVKYFEKVGNSLAQINPQIGLIEPIPGKLFGATSEYLFNYDITTDVTTITNTVGYIVNSELMKASDGYLYGTVRTNGHCLDFVNTLGENGSIIKVNLLNNAITIIHSLSCNFTEGNPPIGQLIEVLPGKLYGVSWYGAYFDSNGNFVTTGGTIFEFNIATNTFTKKLDFNTQTEGSFPQPLVYINNNKIYGVCNQGGPIPYGSYLNKGTIFEFIPSTNTLNILTDFTSSFYSARNPTSLLKTSNGDFIGTWDCHCSGYVGLFKFDPVTNLVTLPNFVNGVLPFNINNMNPLIEICRKPSYHEFTPDTFAPATGSAFTYDIQNTNATTYIWKKGTTVLPLQTTAVLNLPSITTADTGIYTCTMTNECGTTVTMNLYINVDNLGIDLMPIYKKNIILYPNPTLSSLNIELPQNIEIQKCFISNSIGQIVFKSLDNSNKIDVSNLQQGVYIVSLETNYGKWNGKFVKE